MAGNFPEFREGDPLSAAAMRSLVSQMLRSVTGGRGINVAFSGQGLVISQRGEPLRTPGFFYAWLLTNEGDGEYTFEQIQRNAANDGWMTRPNGISSGVTGRNVVMFDGNASRAADPGGGQVCIIRLVDREETTPIYVGVPLLAEPFHARVTAANGSEWEQVTSAGVGTWSTVSDGLTHTNTGKALREIHGATALPFTADSCRVFLVSPAVDSSGEVQYTIDLGRSFHCLLTSGSGSQGDQTTQCARVYTWTYEDGSALASSTAPANMRPSAGFVTDGDEATGRWYNGAFVPGICNEVPDGEACA